jgi:hypothetical protein
MAVLQVDTISGQRTATKITKALESLPPGLTKTYKETLARTNSQEKSDAAFAIRTLLWISHSKRPLHVDELLHALAVEWEDSEEPPNDLDFDNLLDQESLIDVTGGLVVTEPESQIIRLVHFTVEEFFRSSTETLPDDKIELARTCLIYLGFDIFRENAPSSWTELNIQRCYQLLNNAALYWGKHLVEVPESRIKGDIEKLSLRFLGCRRTTGIVCQIAKYSEETLGPDRRSISIGVSGLHLVSRSKLPTLVSKMLGNNFEIDSKT